MLLWPTSTNLIHSYTFYLMLMDETDRLYTLDEAAEFLRVSKETIRRWDRTGKIHCIRLPNGYRRVPASEISRITKGVKKQNGVERGKET